MRYRHIQATGFDFKTDSLSYSTIEDIICKHYGLGYANSSDFMEIEEGSSSEHYITATKGMIEFSMSAYKLPSGNYTVHCYPRSVKVEM